MTIVDDTRVAERAALARAALRSAEQRTGVRHAVAPGPLPGLRAARPAVEIRTSEQAPTSERFWPVHPELAPLLPLGALQRGTSVVVQGSTSLLLALVAEASAAGAWTAMLGHDRVGMVAAADAGVALERTALVPAPGPDAAVAAGALLDGIDLVVVGPQAPLTDADRRRLSSRARERGGVVVSAVPWPGAHVVLTAGAGSWAGLDEGAGWLRTRTLRVERAGRAGAARARTFEIELPLREPAPGRAPGGTAVARTALRDGPDLRLVG